MVAGLECIRQPAGLTELFFCCSTFAQLSLSVHWTCRHTSHTAGQVIHDLSEQASRKGCFQNANP